jgi:hypothetical protein
MALSTSNQSFSYREIRSQSTFNRSKEVLNDITNLVELIDSNGIFEDSKLTNLEIALKVLEIDAIRNCAR